MVDRRRRACAPEFALIQTGSMRWLGIDHGERRVGLALSDEDGRIALPRDTWQRGDPEALLERIAGLVREEGVSEIVVGLPLHLDGREGASARRARRFAEKLGERTGRKVVLWDERLTTAAAQRSLSEARVSVRDQRGVVDEVAAALLLQSYLDSRLEGDETWPSADETAAEPGGDRRRGGRSRGR